MLLDSLLSFNPREVGNTVRTFTNANQLTALFSSFNPREVGNTVRTSKLKNRLSVKDYRFQSPRSGEYCSNIYRRAIVPDGLFQSPRSGEYCSNNLFGEDYKDSLTSGFNPREVGNTVRTKNI